MYKKNAIAVGALFIITMLAGMMDAYYTAPELTVPLTQVLAVDSKLLIGAFSTLFMAIGIVFIALGFYPVIKMQSETLALTYVVFRVIESVLLIVGPIVYLYLIALGRQFAGSPELSHYIAAGTLAVQIKYFGYQIAMIVLGLGSLFLCYSLFRSQIVPRFMSIWGGFGYFMLLASAVLDLCGLIDTKDGLGVLFYVPGGLWEFIVFPGWLFVKGFEIRD